MTSLKRIYERRVRAVSRKANLALYDIYIYIYIYIYVCIYHYAVSVRIVVTAAFAFNACNNCVCSNYTNFNYELNLTFPCLQSAHIISYTVNRNYTITNRL